MAFSPSRKALLQILADGNFHSGTDLAKALETSRTSVWNRMQALGQLGLEYASVYGKGYRLARPYEWLDETTIRQWMNPVAASRLPLFVIDDETPSTNTRLLQMAATSPALPSGTVCLTEHQAAGRGRVGRSWQSPLGGGLCLSLLWWFDQPQAFAGLSLAVGVAMIRALQEEGIVGLGLKWPNDILWQGRKLAGILLEVAGEAHRRYAVVLGIGLNIRMTAAQGQHIDQAWVDLAHITQGNPPPRNRLLARLLDELSEVLASYAESGLKPYLDEWRHWHCQTGKRAVLHVGDQAIWGTVAGINDHGLLLMDCEGEGLRQFASGDLRLRSDDAG